MEKREELKKESLETATETGLDAPWRKEVRRKEMWRRNEADRILKEGGFRFADFKTKISKLYWDEINTLMSKATITGYRDVDKYGIGYKIAEKIVRQVREWEGKT